MQSILVVCYLKLEFELGIRKSRIGSVFHFVNFPLLENSTVTGWWSSYGTVVKSLKDAGADFGGGGGGGTTPETTEI